MRTLFISENIIKAITPLTNQLDVSELSSAIYNTQKLYLEKVIGTNLYNKIENLINSNAIRDVENAKYKDLLDNYIVDYLSYKSLPGILLELNFKLVNKGIVQTSDDKVNPVSINETTYLINHYGTIADGFANKLTHYLRANMNLYPELNQPLNGGFCANLTKYGNCPIYLGKEE